MEEVRSTSISLLSTDPIFALACKYFFFFFPQARTYLWFVLGTVLGSLSVFFWAKGKERC